MHQVNACAWRDLAGLASEEGSLLEMCRKRISEADLKSSSENTSQASLTRAAKRRKLSSAKLSSGGTSTSLGGSSASGAQAASEQAPSAPSAPAAEQAQAQCAPADDEDCDGPPEPEDPDEAPQAVVPEEKKKDGKKKGLTIKEKLDLLKKFEQIKDSGEHKYPEKAPRISRDSHSNHF